MRKLTFMPHNYFDGAHLSIIVISEQSYENALRTNPPFFVTSKTPNFRLIVHKEAANDVAISKRTFMGPIRRKSVFLHTHAYACWNKSK